ncbi:hypothetical protein MMC30_004270 [Trapelia coarctata]|nr:hypothetical protein [Trapelia coarctata]
MSKLPLVVRKSIRDDFDSKKPDLESQISKALGVPWTVSIDAAAVLEHAEDGYAKENPGSMFAAYIEGAIYNLQSFVKEYGDDGKNELNEVALKHNITLNFTDNKDIYYCGCDIADGCLRLLFKKGYLGTNIGQAAQELHRAVNAAGLAAAGADGGKSLDFNAKQSIKLQFDPKIGEIEAKAQKIMAMPSLKLNGNFEAVFAKLAVHAAAGGQDDLPRDWQQQIGTDALRYFDGFVSAIEYAGFAKDDMLQEGFQEGVPKGVVELRVVDKLEKGSYNEVVIDDGVLVMQTIPRYWNTNTSEPAKDLINLL